MNPHDSQRNAARRLAWKLGSVGVLMFAFAVFVLPPLYDVACRLFGINGKTVNRTLAVAAAPDYTRALRVEFFANVYQGTPLEFTAPRPAVRAVHPGEVLEVTYRARNLSNEELWAQAVHSVAPGELARYVKTIACFCFTKQKFSPGEERTFTLAFSVSPELPPEHQVLSFSYTFFKLQSSPENSL